MTYRFHKGYNIVVLALFISVTTPSLTATTEIKIVNNITPLQIGATVFENGGRKGTPSIVVWAPNTGGSGDIVRPQSTWTYDETVADGSSTTFDVQINANRLAGQCGRLCGHVKVKISADGQRCRFSEGTGRCRGDGGAPRWTLSGQKNRLINRGICRITLNQINIISRTVCSCQGERYPCITRVTCLPGTCPVTAPHNW